MPRPADLSPRRTGAVVVRGSLAGIERFMQEVGGLAAREDLFLVYQRTSPAKLRIVDEGAAPP